MSGNVLLNLFNDVWKRFQMQGFIVCLFLNDFNTLIIHEHMNT